MNLPEEIISMPISTFIFCNQMIMRSYCLWQIISDGA